MRKINFLATAVVLLLLLNAGTLVVMFRWHTAKAGIQRGDGPADYIIKTLQLDAQQQAQFAQLRNEHQQAMRLLRDEDRRLHDAYFGLLKTDHPNHASIDSLAGLIGGEEKRLSEATFDHFQKLRALCRDDQKKLFDATIDDIAHRMAPPPQRMPGGGPPPQGADGPPPPGQEGPPQGGPPPDGPPR